MMEATKILPASLFASLRARAEAADPLLRALAEGDVRALGDVYRQCQDEVRAFARRLTGDDTAAEDLVHEVFLALPAAARRMRGECSLRTFILSIATNCARRHIRSAVRRRAMERKLSGTPAAPASTPDDAHDRGRLSAALTEALDALPSDQRVAFVLCEVEERSAADVGALVGAQANTVRARVFHARRRLRETLVRMGIR